MCAGVPTPPTGVLHPPPLARERRAAAQALGCTFFEVRCRRVVAGRVRAHFLRFVAAKGLSAAHEWRPSGRSRCKSAGQSNDKLACHNSKQTRTARKGRKRGARVQRTSKNVHETRFRRRVIRMQVVPPLRWGGALHADLRAAACGRLQVGHASGPRPAARNLHQSPQGGGGRCLCARYGCGAPPT